MSRSIATGLATAAFGFAASIAAAQPAAPVKQLPPGFTVKTNTANSMSVALEATKPNAGKPAIAVDADVHIGFLWQPSPGFAQIVEIMAASPEDPASDQGFSTSEPAGKTLLKGGVLTIRKYTVVQVGSDAPPWVTYNGVWVAAVDNGSLSISVTNYAGPKEHIQPWIEALIPVRAPR